MITVGNIYDCIDSIAPFNTQESWDNSGLLVGNRNSEVKKIAFVLDVTNDTVDKAIEENTSLIVSHHPIIWEPLKFVATDSPIAKCIRNGIAVISAHTNWDMAEGGVNDVLSKMLGLTNITPILPVNGICMLRKGELKTAVPAEEFADIVSGALDTVVRVSLPGKMIKTVAVCGGSGASFLPELVGENIDAFVTGDSKHNDFLDSIEYDISLLAAGHYETETISMPILMNLVKSEFENLEYTYIESTPVVYVG